MPTMTYGLPTRRPCRRVNFEIGSILLGLVVLATSLSTASADTNERGLWQVWRKHTTLTNDHQAVLAACAAFMEQNPGDPLAPVSHTLAAWRLLKMGGAQAYSERA